MSVLDFRCPTCERVIPSRHVDVRALIATCTACGNTFEITGGSPSRIPVPALERVVPPKPSDVEVEGVPTVAPLVLDYRSYGHRTPDTLRIRYRWRGRCGGSLSQANLVKLVVVTLLCSLMTISAGLQGQLGAMLLFLGLSLASFVLLATGGSSSLLEETVFHLERNRLFVTSGALRWSSNIQLAAVPISDLRQLSVMASRENDDRAFGLVAHRHDGSTLVLVEGLPSREAARFVEQAIEYQLGLPDEPWLDQST